MQLQFFFFHPNIHSCCLRNRQEKLFFPHQYLFLKGKIIPKKKETQLFFSDVQGKSIEEVEKKKIELLYKFKHDIKYKIATGRINTEEIENFQEFQEKVNKLKNKFEDYDINLYIKEMEQFFQSFNNEMENSAKKKEDEDRINKYLRQFHEDCNVKQLYKDLFLTTYIQCKMCNSGLINKY